VQPQASTSLTIPFNKDLIKPGAEYFLNFSFVLKNANNWADKDFEIASEQLTIPSPAKTIVITTTNFPSIEVKQANDIVVKGKDFAATFSKELGTLASYNFKGKEFLAAPLVPNF
jgi:beta-galactosidase